jgi:S-DNA-T family DNA segregation ATPase FtsK/SpoIIIE
MGCSVSFIVLVSNLGFGGQAGCARSPKHYSSAFRNLNTNAPYAKGIKAMVRTKRVARVAPPRLPLPPKLIALLRESWLLALIGVAIYLTLILVSYDRSDPAWSQSVSGVSEFRNAGGRFGAWLADILLYLFGAAAYWWIVFFVFAMWWGYKRIEQFSVRDWRPAGIAFIGFLVLLLASSGIEALRLYSEQTALPLAPGGVLGALLSDSLAQALGFTGATLALLTLIAIGFSLFSGVSWVRLTEKLGGTLEDGYHYVIQEGRSFRDRRVGEKAQTRREELVDTEKLRLADREPIFIEPPALDAPKSLRVEREKQVPLFENLPDSPLPPVHLLEPAPEEVESIAPDTLEYTSRLIEKKLADYDVEVKVVAAYPGPVITRYEIEPAVGVKGSQVVNLVKDLARSLSVASIRVVETIPGKTHMGLEIPNPRRQVVRLSEILSTEVYADAGYPLALALGKDIGGAPVVVDLARMPHLLIAGTTGSGKSVAVNAMILSLLFKSSPEHVRMILVDPKMLELSVYEGIPHLLAPVVTDMKHAANALAWCIGEMERRYRLMSSLGVRNLAGYNHKVRDANKHGQSLTDPFSLDPEAPLAEMPLIVLVIDELADLMMVVGKKVEELIARLAQKARAAGVHLILATQRPSVDVITGLIKANVPCRIAFQVSSKVDSRTILDQMGAENLLGQGDMLYLPSGTGHPQRVHGAFVGDQEVHRVVEYLKGLGGPCYVDGILESSEEEGGPIGEGALRDAESDPVYDQAVDIVLNSGRASISLVQRHLRIGYNRAARLIEQMERAGLVSAMQANGNREVLAPAQREA